jgi:hypothetical protein
LARSESTVEESSMFNVEPVAAEAVDATGAGECVNETFEFDESDDDEDC